MAETDPKLVASLAQAEIIRDETNPDEPLHAVLSNLIQQAQLDPEKAQSPDPSV